MPPKNQKRLRLLRRATTILLNVLLAVLFQPRRTSSVKFDISPLNLNSLKLLGDAHLKNNSIRLSRDLPVPNSGAGRALLAAPVRLRHPITGEALPFSTSFSFSVINLNPSSIGGGLTFLLAADDRSIGDSGGFLGLISGGAAAALVAVEFDTLMDVEFDDINDNHVGVDLKSVISARVADLDSAGVDLKSGRLINAWIDYDSRGLIQAFVSYSSVRPINPVLTFPINLTNFVDEFMFVGFSASTQGSTEIHIIKTWTFSSPSATSPAPPPQPYSHSPPKNSNFPPTASTSPAISISAADSPSNKSVKIPSFSSCRRTIFCPAAVIGGAAAFAAIFAFCVFFILHHFFTKRNSTAEIIQTPREFTHRELLAATLSFHPSRIIGHGAFGTVYRAILPNSGDIVAVKRCTNSSSSSRSESLSELSIIAALRHRHLLRLIGFCHHKAEILLVYDYMSRGSLEKSLFSLPILSWPLRRRILAGVASALSYLHHECDRQIIHRDVKSSNVMLDRDFNPRLGDFGLARQTDHGGSPAATAAAGTVGYLAPEYLLTGRATEKTDVYSFGALLLEVVSGRRVVEDRRRGSLVEWVWALHGEGRLIEAVDRRMDGGEMDKGEVTRVLLVGLGCASPDAAARPGMRSVVQMIAGEAEPPEVPPAKPAASFSENQKMILLGLQDSVSDCNAGVGFNLSSSSSSSSSIASAVRGGGGGGGGGGGLVAGG